MASSQVSVRVPCAVADFIDTKFVETELFASKADFIAFAIRGWYDNLLSTFAAVVGNYNTQDNGKTDAHAVTAKTAAVGAVHEEISRGYYFARIGGERKQLLIRVPKSVLQNISEFSDTVNLHTTLSDFVLRAIDYQMFREFESDMYRIAVKENNRGPLNFVKHYSAADLMEWFNHPCDYRINDRWMTAGNF